MIDPDVETFIVRVWVPADGQTPPPNLHGTISHVESGRDAAFGDVAEMLRFLTGEASSRPGGGEAAASESSAKPEPGG